MIAGNRCPRKARIRLYKHPPLSAELGMSRKSLVRRSCHYYESCRPLQTSHQSKILKNPTKGHRSPGISRTIKANGYDNLILIRLCQTRIGINGFTSGDDDSLYSIIDRLASTPHGGEHRFQKMK